MMPAWLSHMFLWSIVIIPLMIANEEKLEVFLDKVIIKSKKRIRKIKRFINAVVLTVKEI